MNIEDELAGVFFSTDHEDGCSVPDCEGCQADYERVLAYVKEKLGVSV